jgi:osmotically inducible protein OsmC
MVVRKAEAIWEGTLKEGRGTMKFGNGAFDGPYSWSSRFEDSPGTNPEELIGAAHAGCFSMALSSGLGKVGFAPKHIFTKAEVTFGKVGEKSRITHIHLDSSAEVPGISLEEFKRIAEETRTGCPVSAALTGVEITLDAKLVQ